MKIQNKSKCVIWIGGVSMQPSEVVEIESTALDNVAVAALIRLGVLSREVEISEAAKVNPIDGAMDIASLIEKVPTMKRAGLTRLCDKLDVAYTDKDDAAAIKKKLLEVLSGMLEAGDGSGKDDAGADNAG